jgi:UDP-N-acetylmuramyl pentapeptide phosphotransferase/UDP-N-acetylglucosamine-1-phosphate transferase
MVSASALVLALAVALTAAVLVHAGIGRLLGWLEERALARPSHRSSHTVPTPQGGGIVLVPVALVTAGVALAVSGSDAAGGPPYAVSIGLAALFLCIVGFIDDMRGLSIASRLAAQALAAAAAVALMPAEMRVFPAMVPLPVERVILLGALWWFVNLFNFMDGIDLISAVETAAIALAVAIFSVLGAIPAAYGYVAVALLGATAGFARWNAPPARLFLGDAGSLPVGFLLGVLLVHGAASGIMAAALILPLYYLADATITLGRRIVRGERVWEAHREHFYQRAVSHGLSVVQVVTRVAVLDIALIVLSVGSWLLGPPWALAACLLAALAVGWTLRVFAKPQR